MNTSRILSLLFLAHVVHVVAIPAVGRIADHLGRKPVYIAGAALAIAWPFAAFPMFDTGQSGIILIAIALGLAIHSLMYAVQPAVMTEMFPTRMRYSGVSLGYQVTAILAGSLAPLIGTVLLRAYGNWLPIAFYIAAASAVSLLAALIMRESKSVDLNALDEEDEARLKRRAQPG